MLGLCAAKGTYRKTQSIKQRIWNLCFLPYLCSISSAVLVDDCQVWLVQTGICWRGEVQHLKRKTKSLCKIDYEYAWICRVACSVACKFVARAGHTHTRRAVCEQSLSMSLYRHAASSCVFFVNGMNEAEKAAGCEVQQIATYGQRHYCHSCVWLCCFDEG